MDLTQLANLGEFIGGVAVLVTLVYLALQVRSTQRQLNDQSLTSAFQTLYDAYQPFFMGENHDLINAGLTQEREFSPSEATFRTPLRRISDARPAAGRPLRRGRASGEIPATPGAPLPA